MAELWAPCPGLLSRRNRLPRSSKCEKNDDVLQPAIIVDLHRIADAISIYTILLLRLSAVLVPRQLKDTRCSKHDEMRGRRNVEIRLPYSSDCGNAISRISIISQGVNDVWLYRIGEGGAAVRQTGVFPSGPGQHAQLQRNAIISRNYYGLHLWYAAYGYVEEMMEERSVFLDHATVTRWAVRFLPRVAKVSRRHKRPVGRSWRMDESYVKLKGV